MTSTKNKALRDVPHQWWKISLFNLIQLKLNGWDFFQQQIEKHQSTVFCAKIFNDWTTFVCDHVAVAAVLDMTKTERSKTGHGFLELRPEMMLGQTPCVFSVGEGHQIHKPFIMNFVAKSYEKQKPNMVAIIEKEFKVLSKHGIGGASSVDWEGMFSTAAKRVICHMLLGVHIEDITPLEKYTQGMLTMEKMPGEADTLIENIMTIFNKVDSIKNLSIQFSNSGLTQEEMFKDICYVVCLDASNAITIFVLNSLYCYLRLSSNDKQLLRTEADQYFKDPEQTNLSALPNLHKFFTEMLRWSSKAFIYGKAKSDFQLDSTSGKFRINKGDLLCALPYFIHRDDQLFENPEQFDMHRNPEESEKYNFTYGGRFLGQSTPSNHRCAGFSLSRDVVKTFILFFTRCQFEQIGVTEWTGGKISRKYASDEPLKLSSFKFE
eukprot:TCONS_00070663-protein